MPAGANAKLCFLAPGGILATATETFAKAAHGIKDRPSERHIAANRIANRAQPVRQALVTAADHPLEFSWKPARLLIWPKWQHLATDADNVWIPIVQSEPLQPVGFGDSVVVKKCNDIAGRGGTHAGVSRTRETFCPVIGDHLDTWVKGPHVPQQVVVVVDDDDEPIRSAGLFQYRINSVAQL
ncbi:hypothetical protein D9M68_502110 [compost metagenome]